MVEMGVGVEQMLYCQIVFCDKSAQLLLLLGQERAAVHNHRLAAFVPKQIAIFFDEVDGKCLVMERAHLFMEKNIYRHGT